MTDAHNHFACLFIFTKKVLLLQYKVLDLRLELANGCLATKNLNRIFKA